MHHKNILKILFLITNFSITTLALAAPADFDGKWNGLISCSSDLIDPKLVAFTRNNIYSIENGRINARYTTTGGQNTLISEGLINNKIAKLTINGSNTKKSWAFNFTGSATSANKITFSGNSVDEVGKRRDCTMVFTVVEPATNSLAYKELQTAPTTTPALNSSRSSEVKIISPSSTTSEVPKQNQQTEQLEATTSEEPQAPPVTQPPSYNSFSIDDALNNTYILVALLITLLVVAFLIIRATLRFLKRKTIQAANLAKDRVHAIQTSVAQNINELKEKTTNLTDAAKTQINSMSSLTDTFADSHKKEGLEIMDKPELESNNNGANSNTEQQINQPSPTKNNQNIKSYNFQDASDLITSKLGLEKIEGFSLASFFSEVFKKHDPNEVENLFTVGSMLTTPSLHKSMGELPSPWLFFRVLVGAIIVYSLFLISWHEYKNINVIPGLIIVGSFAVPFSVLILFYEINTPKNVSIVKVIQLLVSGGALSILISLLLFEVTPFFGIFGAPAAGLIEEVGKLLTVLLALRLISIERYKYRINALLFGAAVGAGFAAFESAGYALRIGLSNAQAMLDNITLRGAMSPFAHIVWTAIATSAYWIARKDHPDFISTIKSRKFLLLFSVPVGLHFLWNTNFEGPFLIKFWILGFIAWVVVISLIQSALKEIDEMASSRS